MAVASGLFLESVNVLHRDCMIEIKLSDRQLIKSTGTLTNLKTRFWTCTEVKQIFQANPVEGRGVGGGAEMRSGRRRQRALTMMRPAGGNISARTRKLRFSQTLWGMRAAHPHAKIV
uniref:Uncharacterized protein n=1 Tax=Oryza sativa subsp. japonica TaxID=39947 RepID=Q8W2S5_ORYSJ|nr:hypothetical protein [Oryza sativa Japonica Group]